MGKTGIILFGFIVIVIVAWITAWFHDHRDAAAGNQVSQSEIAQVGIDAGINACLTSGRMRPQMSEQELNDLKSRARRLMDMLYPEQKFQWPQLKERGIVGRVPEA